jgi:ABC-type glycerol-3-phosphate transport system permease component
MAAAAAVTTTVPITILYLALHRYFVQGVLDSALKMTAR